MRQLFALLILFFMPSLVFAQAAQRALTIEQGATFSYEIACSSDGEAMDLTGYEARMQARYSVSDDSPVIDLSLGNGITIDAEAGTVTITIDAEDTGSLTPGKLLRYDIEIESPSGHVTRLLQGTIEVSPEITR